MRAVLTVAHGGRDLIRVDEHFPDPRAAAGEVVVRVAATGVNFHDLFTRRGMLGVKIEFPIIVGSDIAGTVDEVGPGSNPAWLNKRVLIDPVLREGDRIGMIGETLHGGRAERVAVRESMLLEIPAGVSMEEAASLPLAYGTAYRMVIARGGLKAGERILILGASGGVGVACVQLAKLVGAEVLACASSQAKLARLRAIGADHVVNYRESPFQEKVKELYGKPRVRGGGGVDVAVNFTGGETLIPTQKSVRLGGKILCCGATAGFELQLDARYWWTFEHTMIGSNGWVREDLRKLLDLVASRKLLPVIDRVLDLEQAAEAERLLEERLVTGKILLRPAAARS
jgi:alcohol dehydrogenase